MKNQKPERNYNTINDGESVEPITFQYVVMEPERCSVCCSRLVFIVINLIIFV